MSTENGHPENSLGRIIGADEAYVIAASPEARKVIDDLARGSRHVPDASK